MRIEIALAPNYLGHDVFVSGPLNFPFLKDGIEVGRVIKIQNNRFVVEIKDEYRDIVLAGLQANHLQFSVPKGGVR